MDTTAYQNKDLKCYLIILYQFNSNIIMPGLTPSRVRLTLSQKVKIIEESKKSDFSRKKICEEYSISKATISSILKDQKTHLENYDSGIPGKHKTMRKPDFPEIELTLYEWFTKMTRLNVPVSGPMLIGKAKKLHSNSKYKNDEFLFSSGWLEGFKKRYNIKFKTIVGEIKSSDMPAAERWLTEKWPEIREEYDPQDIILTYIANI